jgi:protein phosphatase 1 regulatory subunit 11
MATHSPNRRTMRSDAYASATQTITTTPAQEASQSARPEQNTSDPLPIRVPASGTLRLRAEATTEVTQTQQQAPAAPERRVQWAESVVNNEGMGKKSSKVCCIYHKPREPGESSDEDDSSDSDSDSDSSGGDDGAARPAQGRGRRAQDHGHEHGADGDCAGGDGHARSHGKEKRRKNAYERQPRNT